MSPRACEVCRHDNNDFADRCSSCGTAFAASVTAQTSHVGVAPVEDSWLGRVFSHYRVDALLGKGGMGVVYRGSDLKLRRPVALKFLAPTFAHDPQARARFMREARAASALDHPNIGTLFDIDEVDGTAFLSMALYEGETLRQRLERGPLAESEAVRIAAALTSALEAAHAAGITHRDLKPGNVMLTRDGQVKLLDFGLAKLLSGGEDLLTTDGAALGTPAYMAPEQLRAEAAGPHVDWWALGVVLYEMVAGRSPFGKGTTAVVCSRILSEAPTPLPESVSPPLRELIGKLMRKDASARISDSKVISGALSGERKISAPRRWYLWLLLLPLFGALAWRMFPVDKPPAPPMVVAPSPAPRASLAVSSNASSANWWLDGKSIATSVSAVTVHDLTAGSHQLRVEAGGFQPRESALELTAGQTLEVRWSLEPLKAPPKRPAKPRDAQPKVTWPPPE